MDVILKSCGSESQCGFIGVRRTKIGKALGIIATLRKKPSHVKLVKAQSLSLLSCSLQSKKKAHALRYCSDERKVEHAESHYR